MNTLYKSALLGMMAIFSAHIQGEPHSRPSRTPTAASTLSDKPVGLAIHGFNYTDRVIESFSIDFQGGGNIAVSSPTSGGGKTTCCMRWYPGNQLSRPVKIEWMRYRDDKQRWCKKTVMLKSPFPNNPTDVGVHFMPNGDIEVELAEGFPELKLHLENYDEGHRKKEGNIVYDEKTANCRDDY
jgi:hypothetical protein